MGCGGSIWFTTKFELEALQADVGLSNLSNGLSMGGREAGEMPVTTKFELEALQADVALVRASQTVYRWAAGEAGEMPGSSPITSTE